MLGTVQHSRTAMPQISAADNGLVYPSTAANSMGSIASLVSAGLLPQGNGTAQQAMPQHSLGHLAALLDLPTAGRTATALMMPTSIPY